MDRPGKRRGDGFFPRRQVFIEPSAEVGDLWVVPNARFGPGDEPLSDLTRSDGDVALSARQQAEDDRRAADQ